MKKRFFVKRFCTYFLTILIPTIIIFCMVFYIMLGSTKARLKADTDNSLLIANNNLDLIISNVAYQNDLMTTSPEYALSLNELLNQNQIEYNYLIFLKSLRTVLSSMVESHNYVDSIYLYLNGANKFFSSSTGVEPIDSYHDNSWYKTIQSFKKSKQPVDRWVEKRIVKMSSFSEGKDYITLYQRMKYVAGIIVINIDSKKFTGILNTIFNDDSTSVFIINNKNEILVSNSNGEKQTEVFRKSLLTKLSKKGINGEWTTLDKGNYQICSTEYTDYGLDIVSVVSEKTLLKQLMPTIWTLALIFLVNCFIVLVMAYIVTKRNFYRISHIINTFDNAELGIYPKKSLNSKVNDEYDLIMNDVVNMFINTSYLNSQLEQKQYKQKVAELTALQTQINPHFLFNTLQTLQFEILKCKDSDVSSISMIIQELSEILRYALMPSTQMVPLRQEISYLKKYIEIQKFRFNNKLIVYYQTDDGIMDHPISRLILQPLVENSILHGVRYVNKTGYIKLKIQHKQNYLYFYVIDNGIGMKRDEIIKLYKNINNENSTSIGLSNVNHRLKLNYGDSYGLHIWSKKGFGTCVSFKIPYHLSN